MKRRDVMKLGAELKARPRRTEGTPDQVAYADIQAFNDGLGARLYVGRSEIRTLDFDSTIEYHPSGYRE